MAARLVQTAAQGRAVSCVRFVNEERAALLGRLGVRTVGDELYAVPKRYLDFTTVTPVALAAVGQEATVVGDGRTRVEVKKPRPRMVVVELSCYDETAPLAVPVRLANRGWRASSGTASEWPSAARWGSPTVSSA